MYSEPRGRWVGEVGRKVPELDLLGPVGSSSERLEILDEVIWCGNAFLSNRAPLLHGSSQQTPKVAL